MALGLFVAAMFLLGHAIARWLWQRPSADGMLAAVLPAEYVSSSVLLGLAVWVATSWILSAFHALDRGPLLATAGLAGALGTVLLLRGRGRPIRMVPADPNPSPRWLTLGLAVACGLPLALWLAYILWRGAVIPVCTHDALAYHMPRAMMVLRAHGYGFFNAPDPRIAISPINYELLLADILSLDGSDRVTEWLGTLSYMVFLLLSGALAQRFWGRGMHVLGVIVVTAGIPTLLLHSGAHKNDVLMGDFCLAALLFGARWLTQGGTAAGLLCIVSTALAAGTKVHGLGLAAILGLAGLLRFRTAVPAERSLGRFASALGAAMGAFLLLGGVVYLNNILHQGTPVGRFELRGTRALSPIAGGGYGDWNNLWQFPYLLLARPLSGDMAVWVPWRREYWFWPRYEFYFSDYGILFTVLCAALPLAAWFYAKRYLADGRRNERKVASAIGLAAVLAILPVKFRPLGFFGGFPRYILFAAPILICWTLAPTLLYLSKGRRHGLLAAVLLVCGLVLARNGLDYAERDAFAPLEYALESARRPDARVIFFQPQRAASVVDGMAGPNQTIAIDGTMDTWIYPAYGRGLGRPVEFISPMDPIVIPERADWVVIDRGWNIFWGHPKFEDMGQFRQYAERGRPSDDDIRVLKYLWRDSRFKRVYYDPRYNQAVFRRVR